MARPIKTGLDYFPMDVEFFTDDKLQFVSARFDEKGELIAIKLLCKIYKNGYFIQWDEDTTLLFAKAAGKNITPGLVNEVVNELLKRGFFDNTLHKRFGILTSNGIQKRYLSICQISKRKNYEIPLKFQSTTLNQELTEFTQQETPINTAESTQSKVKEIKENESKVLSHDDFEKKIQEVLNSHSWIESVAMQYKENYDVVIVKLDYFLKELKLKEDLYKSIREIKSHFINCLKKEKNSTQKQSDGTSPKFTGASNQRISRQNERSELRDGLNKIFTNGENNDASPNSTIDTEAVVIQSGPNPG